MEKQRRCFYAKSGRRLLVLLFLLVLQNFCYSQNLKVVPAENQNIFVDKDIKLELFIPKVSSSQVQISTYPQNSAATLRTARKSDIYEENTGTLLELWYNFEKPGAHHLSDLVLLVKNRRYRIPVETLVVTEDPSSKLPRIVIKFDDGKTFYSDEVANGTELFDWGVGTKLNFTLYVQYAVQVLQIDWELPKNSILSKKKSYEITELKTRERNFSDDLVPVADFEWTVLTGGLEVLPKIVMVCISYKGYRNELILPEYKINFNIPSHTVQTAEQQIFDNAFDESFVNALEDKMVVIDYEHCKKLAQLRSLERHKIINHHKYVKQRADFENVLNLPSETKEFFDGFYFLALFFVLFFIFLLVVAIKNKIVVRQLASFILLGVSTAVFIYTAHLRVKKYAVSAGAVIYSIPEENAKVSSNIPEGNRMLVKAVSKPWVFIQTEQISGWCKEDSIIYIK